MVTGRLQIKESVITLYLGVGENGGNVEASRALNIHEETVGSLNQSFKLVLGLLVSKGRVEKVLGHFCG